MQEFKKSVAGIINRQEKAIGRKFWLDEYYERIIRDEKEYQNDLDYIWLNPVKKRFVETPGDYGFSSANPTVKTDREMFY